MRVRDGKLSCSRAASSLHRPVSVVKSPCSFRPGAVLVRVLAKPWRHLGLCASPHPSAVVDEPRR
jgi:hypothetical protein